MSDKKLTSIEFLYAELHKKITVWSSPGPTGTSQVHIVFDSGDLIKLINEAREMYQDEIEAAAIIAAAEKGTQNASETSQAFAIGYSQGYTRALQLVQWQIENQLKTETK